MRRVLLFLTLTFAVGLWTSDADACGLLRLLRAMRWGQGQSQNNADFTTQTWGGRASTPLKRVRVLLALDTDAKFQDPDGKESPMAPVCEAIEPVVRNTLNLVSKDAEVVFDPPLKGPNVRLSAIRDYYNNLSTSRSECLVFYYLGHGARDDSGGHFLDVTHEEERLYRSIVRNYMVQKHPGLVVMLTESCAVSVAAPAAAPPKVVAVPLNVPRDLLLMHRGVVDCNACSQDHTALAGVFSAALNGLFDSAHFALLSPSITPHDLDPDGDGFVQWEDGFQFLRKLTQELDTKYHPSHETQTPHAFYLPGRQLVADDWGP